MSFRAGGIWSVGDGLCRCLGGDYYDIQDPVAKPTSRVI